MAMAACYPNYDLSSSAGIGHQQQQQPSQLHHLSMSSRLTGGAPSMAQKDYSIPLHVDCSVEYELPNQAKPPVGARVEPLLMIHPCYFRKMESQRRSPFINNMPNSSRSSNSIVANVVDSSSMSRRSSKSSSQQQQQTQQQHQQQQQQQQHAVVTSHQSTIQRHQNLQQQIDEYVQRQMAQRSQQAHYPVGTSSQQQQQQQQQQSQHVQSQHHRHHSHQQQPQQQQQQQLHQQQSHLSSQQQSTNQYSLQSQQQQQQQQLVNTSDWSCYMAPDGVVRGYRKPNLANQTAYSNSNSSSSSSVSNNSKSKVIKRSNTGMPPQLTAAGTGGHQQHQQQHQQNLIAASCAAFNSGGSGLEGGLPSGPRWDIEKTSMAAVPRDFQAGPESLPIKANASLLAAAAVGCQTAPAGTNNNNNNNSYQPSATMYRNPSVVGKRDAMLSGGCGVYSNSSNNNNNLRNNNNNGTELHGSGGSSGSLWNSTASLLEKTPMAAIPRDYQTGPEHMACSKMSAGTGGMLGATASGHSLMRSAASSNTAPSSYHHNHLHHQSSSSTSSSVSSAAEKAALFPGKYRQHQRASHRLHPYMMTSSMGGSFPPLMAPAFPQMQQVSCYNV
ncbi:centrosomal and chromosomal factor [Aedes albopictus]|uniref:Ccaat-binding transcription factor chain b species n=1 Tax=Aedes albopictus TaxID=7160 RepID=A0ABM1YWN3_AEDAL